MIEKIVTVVIVAGALFFMVRKFIRTASSKEGGCASCDGCSLGRDRCDPQ
ncbi:MAG: FeoB-associated Cys-rich membrane protein [Lentisphaerae bacterium]|jgi:hypothetical protein|nr:FeoB-associated Cys-rich membrane protein [Lentisphaerota bacterium]